MKIKYLSGKMPKKSRANRGGLGKKATIFGLASILTLLTACGNQTEAPVVAETPTTIEVSVEELQALKDRLEVLEAANEAVEEEVEVSKEVQIFEKGLAVITEELAEMGISEEEAKSLYVAANIDYFMSEESNNAFGDIYTDGFDIEKTFEKAEHAIFKIRENDSKQISAGRIYDLARLFMVSEKDAVSLRALSQVIYNVESDNTELATSAVSTIKGYSQLSTDVTVDYATTDEAGKDIDVSLNKNDLGLGGNQVANWYTFYSVEANKDIYGQSTDVVKALVDGSQKGFDPYSEIVLMITDYCAENDIVMLGNSIKK